MRVVKEKKGRLNEHECVDRINKLLSIMDKPFTTRDVVNALGVSIESAHHILGKLMDNSGGSKVLVTRFKENNANPRNNNIPFFYVKHVDSVTLSDFDYVPRADRKANKELRAAQEAAKAVDIAETPLKAGSPRVYSSNDNPWHFEKKKSNRNHASGASLSALSFTANC
jgi:hypothetical protein